jgi:hypothetical protein
MNEPNACTYLEHLKELLKKEIETVNTLKQNSGATNNYHDTCTFREIEKKLALFISSLDMEANPRAQTIAI